MVKDHKKKEDRMKKLLIAALLIITHATTALAADTLDYFPLDVGNFWVYTPSYGEKGDRRDSIIGMETVGGVQTYIWNRQEAPDDNYNEKRWLAKDSTYLRVHKFWANEGVDTAVIPSQPWAMLKLLPALGDTWTINTDIGSINVFATYYVESIDDSVEVPAGSFKNCFRLRVLYEVVESDHTAYDYEKFWYAPGVGLVLHCDYTDNWASVKIEQELKSYSVGGEGYTVTSSLWLKAVLQPASGPVNLIWKEVGSDTTPSGDRVISGYFYADPNDFAYGSLYNPEIFVKIYIASNGWANIAFNHVTVDEVTVDSAHNYNGAADMTGSVTLNDRLEEHQYNGVSLQ